MNNYKLINFGGTPVGPLNLLEIFGPLCDAERQLLTLDVDEEFEFCGEGEDQTLVEDRLKARLAALGTQLGGAGVFLSWSPKVTPVVEEEVQPAPEPGPPPLEP
jgi:hypothetical protein